MGCKECKRPGAAQVAQAVKAAKRIRQALIKLQGDSATYLSSDAAEALVSCLDDAEKIVAELTGATQVS